MGVSVVYWESHVVKSFCLLISLFGLIGLAPAQSASLQAFDSAIRQKDPEARVRALELFLNSYPDPSLRERALESLVAAYQKTHDPKEWSALDDLLHTNPDNLYGLTLKATLPCDNEPRPGACDAEDTAIADHGLQALATATRPDYLSENDFALRKVQAAIAFHTLAGKVALRQKDFQGAQQHLRTAVGFAPSKLDCVYALALAYINADPPNTEQGLFYLARTAHLAKGTALKSIVDYAKTEYVKYHGSEQGWAELLNLAKTSPTTPARFVIRPRP